MINSAGIFITGGYSFYHRL